MSDTQTAAPAPLQLPPLAVNLQYVKDMSFEVPGAPAIFTTLRAEPRVDVSLDVQARRLSDTPAVFEVMLTIKAVAHEQQPNGAPVPPDASPLFIAELAYGGVFTLTGFPDEVIEPVLLVECPRLLFPYARAILSAATRDGGFAPMLIQPMDFVAMYQQRRAQIAAAADAPALAA